MEEAASSGGGATTNYPCSSSYCVAAAGVSETEGLEEALEKKKRKKRRRRRRRSGGDTCECDLHHGIVLALDLTTRIMVASDRRGGGRARDLEEEAPKKLEVEEVMTLRRMHRRSSLWCDSSGGWVGEVQRV